MQTRRRDIASLLDENKRLRVQLKRCDMARQEAERQVVELQAYAHRAETSMAQQLRLKETEWMAEYDRSVHALLKIIQYHEDEKAQLKAEVEQLSATAAVAPPSITKMTRSTQTETFEPAKVAIRRNSVRFAKETGDMALKKEDKPFVDAKVKASIARMQQLFEQLHVSRDPHDSKSVNRPKSVGDDDVKSGITQVDNEHCSFERSSRFKVTVLERLGEHKTETRTVRRRKTAANTACEDRKTIETQTDEISSQEMPSIILRQDLEERNRLLHERLASQQRVLDQLLHTKLKDVSSCAEQNDPVSSTPSYIPGEFAGNHQVVGETNCENRIPTEISATHPDSNDGMNIESAEITERRPLSPPAA
ncbi:hypothetical protein L917_04594 [Phytophthora nicotianae]|uniref:Uncharacterized protein n=3 Tax=Phytophthora nicotianae TaxID=4792 RepID=V9FM79_PHYNI|nr:hypothetical protein F443_04880 [Phytophthora nicotianae P1569]ETK91758.1 hypothetical protein L915_04747 [Phytophthora nicotianae]ETL98296.1 hypothetical protein L917_04594 [Phytophthora nicotianae]